MSIINYTTISFARNKPRVTENSQRAGFEAGVSGIRTRKQTALTVAERQKKSADIERLLERKNRATGAMDSQTDSTVQQYVAKERRMVQPGSKDAPKFKSTKPEELRRFIRLMEDLWKDAGITDDEAKKSMIGKYADPDSEEEWSAFDSFEKGISWDEFKEELIANYPEAAAAERGTPARLRELCKETNKIRLGDMPALYGFRRAFLAEAKKLRKPPAAMANRELVELFIGCLSEALASAVLQHLGRYETEARAKEKATSVAVTRRPEDKYDLEDICKAAIQVSENSQGMFSLMKKKSSEDRSVYSFSQPASETRALADKVEELEGEHALEKDKLNSMNKELLSKIGEVEGLMKDLLTQNQSTCKSNCKESSGRSQEGTSSSRDTEQKYGRSLEHEKCFWCGNPGHFQADCEDLKSQLKAGNVKVNAEGKYRMRDGSYLPNQPAGVPMKERVDRHYARKPSQYFYGEFEENDPVVPSSPKISPQYLSTSENVERRIARLEAELELKKKEMALDQREKKLEQEKKKLEKSGGNSRAVNVVDLLSSLTEEELAALKAVKKDFS